jgi:hypothetical protein
MPTNQADDGAFKINADRRIAVPRTAAWVGICCALLLLFFGGSQSRAENAAGHVVYLKGNASAQRAETPRELSERAPVFEADLIKTRDGTRLGLRLGARTTLKLGSNGSVRLNKYLMDAGGEIDLESGAIQFERTGPPAKTELQIKSPYGLIIVRGTRFFAGPSKGAFGVLVGSGRVTVTSGGVTVVVGAQQGTDIARPGAAPSPPKRWAGPRVADALRSIR